MATSFFRDRFALPSALTAAGHLVHKAQGIRGRSLDSFALVYLTSGQGTYRDDRVGHLAVTAGDLLVLRPGVVQDYGPDTPGNWSERFVVFHGPVFDALAADGLIDAAHPVWRIGLDPVLRDAFAELDRRLQDPAVDQMWCVARLHLLLVEAARRAAHRCGDFLAAATAALAEDLAGTLRLGAIAARFGLSEQVFRKRFARLTGVPPARWRQQRRIDRAKTLLITGTDALATIADQLGWCDVFFFARQFKQATGQSPGAFRAAFRGSPGASRPSLEREDGALSMRGRSPAKRP